jgi:hypothetical protein
MTADANQVRFSSKPSIEEIAGLLSRELPDAERAEAMRLLVEVILPWELRALGGHPRPVALAQAAYDDLEAALRSRPPADRLAALQGRALHARAAQAAGAAMDLALRRYALDHPSRAEQATSRLADPAVGALAREETVARAVSLAAAIDALERQARASAPRVWEAERLTLFQARLAAGSATTGSFATATGPLADVLRELGEQPSILRVH